MILALKTSGDPTELYLLDEAGTVIREKHWDAGRGLARDLLGEIKQLFGTRHSGLDPESRSRGVGKANTNSTWILSQAQDDGGKEVRGGAQETFREVTGIIIFRGPGSFTGLRIGISTANALAYANNIPIVGATGENWRESGLKKLRKKQNDAIVLPEYGAEPHATIPKK
jgi:tRNA threonylcarbamoyladenosine biosynthesis protein TsaB